MAQGESKGHQWTPQADYGPVRPFDSVGSLSRNKKSRRCCARAVAGPVEDDAVALSWYSKAADQVNLSAAGRF
jgi:hypothetical protein